MIYDIRDLVRMANDSSALVPGYGWVPARPLSGTFRFEKLKSAWAVFRGRADAVKWPGQP